MLRRRILTAVVVLISCIIAFGGFYVMKKLLLQKEESLLSQSGTIPVTGTELTEADSSPRAELTRDELIQVLKSMESPREEKPHEPFGQQLSMKEAIEKGDQWMEQFYGKYAGKKYEGKGLYVSGVLCDKGPEIQKGTIDDELYSYWIVEYIVKNAEVTLFLNSVTGQVLRAKIMSYERIADGKDSVDREGLLGSYVESFALKVKPDIKKKGDMRYVKLGKGLYAILSERQIGVVYSHSNSYADTKTYDGLGGTAWTLYVSTELEQDDLQVSSNNQTIN